MKTIGIYDSGCGGFSILNEIIKNGFSGTIFYYADSINNPWGEKSKLELRVILSTIAQWFKSHNVTNIISGCNTTYSLFKNDLNTIFNLPVNNIFEETKQYYTSDTYTALCTENSFKSDLFSSMFPEKKIEEIACPNLAKLIETNQKEKAIELASTFIKKAHFNTIILGCTHYALLNDSLSKKHPEFNFVDPAKYYNQSERNIDRNYTIYFKITGNKKVFLQNISEYLETTNFIIEKSQNQRLTHH